MRENQLCYKGRPRLKTAYELFMASLEIERTLNEVIPRKIGLIKILLADTS